MSWKLEIKGRNMYLSNTDTDTLHYGGCSDFLFDRKKITTNAYVVYLRGTNVTGGSIPFSEFVDKNGNPFLEGELESFIDENTGFNSAPGGSGAVGFKQLATFSDFLIEKAISKPYLRIVNVLTDEDKNIEGTVYHIYPNGDYYWIAANKQI